MEVDCLSEKRRCLKEVNPEVYPGVFAGIPWEFDENWGACRDCQSFRRDVLDKDFQPSIEENIESKIKLFRIFKGLGPDPNKKMVLVKRVQKVKIDSNEGISLF